MPALPVRGRGRRIVEVEHGRRRVDQEAEETRYAPALATASIPVTGKRSIARLFTKMCADYVNAGLLIAGNGAGDGGAPAATPQQARRKKDTYCHPASPRPGSFWMSQVGGYTSWMQNPLSMDMVCIWQYASVNTGTTTRPIKHGQRPSHTAHFVRQAKTDQPEDHQRVCVSGVLPQISAHPFHIACRPRRPPCARSMCQRVLWTRCGMALQLCWWLHFRCVQSNSRRRYRLDTYAFTGSPVSSAAVYFHCGYLLPQQRDLKVKDSEKPHGQKSGTDMIIRPARCDEVVKM